MTKEQTDRLIMHHLAEIKAVFRYLRCNRQNKNDPVWYVYLTPQHKIVVRQNLLYYDVNGDITLAKDCVCLGMLDVSQEWIRGRER